MSSKTPRTDAREVTVLYAWEHAISPAEKYAPADFARTLELDLERTREALREAVDAWERWADDVGSERARIAAIRKEFNL